MQDLNLQLNLQATDKGLVGVINKTKHELRKLNHTLENTDHATQKTAKSTGILKNHWHRMTAAVGIFSVFRQASQQIIGFGQALSDLSAITGATGKDLAFYRQEAIRLGSSSTQSAAQIVNAFKLVGSAKPELLDNREALASVTREVVTLAEASGLEMPQATSVAVTALNQFGVGADQASRFVNVLAAGAKYGASEIPNVGLALKNTGVSAAAANVSFEETNALLQLLAQKGIQGAEAGTALRNILLRLENTGDQELTPSLVGISAALENLADKNLSTADTTKLFGLENINAAQGLIDLRKELEPLTQKFTDTTTATEQARVRTDNLNGDVIKLSNAYNSLIASFSSSDGVFREVIQNLTDMVRYVGNNNEVVQTLITHALTAGGAFATWRVLQKVSGYMNTYKVAVQGATLATKGLVRSIAPIAAILVVTEGMMAYINYMRNLKEAEEDLKNAQEETLASMQKLSAARYENNLERLQADISSKREEVRQLREQLKQEKGINNSTDATITAQGLSNPLSRAVSSFDKQTQNQTAISALTEKLKVQEMALQSLVGAERELQQSQEKTHQEKTNQTEEQMMLIGELSDEEQSRADKLNDTTKQIIKTAQEESVKNAQIVRDFWAEISQVEKDEYDQRRDTIKQWYEETEERLRGVSDDYWSLIHAADEYKNKLLAQVDAEEKLKQIQELKRSNAQFDQELTNETLVSDDPLIRIEEQQQAELDLLYQQIEEKNAILIAQREKEYIDEELYKERLIELELRKQDAITNIRQKAQKKRDKFEERGLRTTLSLTGSLLGQIGEIQKTKGKEGFERWKALSTAQALISTYLAVTNALATPAPPPIPQIQAGIIGAMGAVQVAKIQSQQYQAREFGGPVASGTPYIVGERGPELFVPPNSGTIINNRSITQAKASTVMPKPQINVEIVNNSNEVDVEVEQDDNGGLRVLIEQVDAGIAQGINRGTSETGRAIQRVYGNRRVV